MRLRGGLGSLFRTLVGASVLSFGCAAHDAAPRAAETCGCSEKQACPAGFVCRTRLCMPVEKPGEAAPVVAAAPSSAPPQAPKETRFVIEGTEIHELVSQTNGRAYQIVVAPPAKPEPGKRFTTVYVLDGYWDFPLVHAMRGSLYYDEAIPDVMIVGIGYGGSSPDVAALRASDYTPTAHASRPNSGRGPEFLRFLESELFPLIESRYPSDPTHRVLAGASFGGLFTLYALFEKPELFYGYVAMTPAVGWDDGWIGKRERELTKVKRDALERRLWLSFGDSEEPEKVKRGRNFMRELEAHKHPGLAVRARLVEGERHAAMKNESYNRGLRFVLAPLAAKPSK